MSGLFVVLAFMSLVGLVIGLIMPNAFRPAFGEKTNRKNIGLTFLATTILFTILIGVFNKPATTDTAATTPATETATTLKVTALFDIPSLVGKNIDQIRVELGEPTDKQKELTKQQQSGSPIWYNSFKSKTASNNELLVTFNSSTRAVIDFFIEADDSSGQTKDKNRLLALGNLKENDPKYKVEFVETIQAPSFYTGVKAIPNKSD